MLCRCSWVDLSKADYVAYHDTEWGVPVHDDARLFEFIVLSMVRPRTRLRILGNPNMQVVLQLDLALLHQ